MNRSFFLFLFPLLLPSCKDTGSQQDYSREQYSLAKEAQFSEEAPAPDAPSPKIILTASMRCRVKDVERSTRVIRQYAEDMKGSVTQMNWARNPNSIENTMTIRIPSSRLDTLIEFIRKEASYIHYRNLQSQDVTAEYLDIETRLRTKKEVRDRYIDLLRNKARTLSEVLDAEEKIRVLQEEIEAQEGRLKYLSDQVALSTLTLELYQPVEYQPEPESVSYPFGKRLGENLKEGFELLQNLVLGFIYLWPLWIVGILVYAVWKWRRNRKKVSHV